MEMILIAVLIILLGLSAWYERRNARWWGLDLAVNRRDMMVISGFYRLQLDAQNEIFGQYTISDEVFVVPQTMIKLEYLWPDRSYYRWRDLSDGPNPYIGTPEP